MYTRDQNFLMTIKQLMPLFSSNCGNKSSKSGKMSSTSKEKYPEELNPEIKSDFSINYQIYQTEEHTTRMQLMQCFNYYRYGHHIKPRHTVEIAENLTKLKAAKTLQCQDVSGYS